MSGPSPFAIPIQRKELTPSAETRMVVMSDMHRGDGTGSDDMRFDLTLKKMSPDGFL